MTRTRDILEQVDCRDVVEAVLGKPKSRSADTYIYKCPFHQDKTPSFAVYKDGWTCFGSCHESGNAIKFLEKFHGWYWKDAAVHLVQTYNLDPALLGKDAKQMRSRRPLPRPAARTAAPAATEPPAREWQQYARKLVDMAVDTLWSPAGEKARHYLRATRGFTQFMIKNARLGYIPAEKPDDYTYGRVLFPDWMHEGKPVRAHCGITVPHFADKQLWAVRVRRPPGIEGAKYMGIRGGTKALYWVDNVHPGMPVIITEGEFDALCLDSSAFNLVCPVALASASNKHIDNRWLAKLMTAPVVLARLDADGAGESASATLRQLNIKSVQVPAPYKDVNEFYLGAGREAVKVWVEESLNG